MKDKNWKFISDYIKLMEEDDNFERIRRLDYKIKKYGLEKVIWVNQKSGELKRWK